MTLDPRLILVAAPSIDPSVAASTILLALGLGLVIALVYRSSIPGRIVLPSMPGTIVLMATLSSLLMIVVGNSLARAFSLVGAFALVRFRTLLESPWDVTFIFFALGVGIATGIGAWQVAILGTGLVSLAVVAMYAFPIFGLRSDVLLLRADYSAYTGVEPEIAKVLDRHVHARWLVQSLSMRFGETLSVRWRVTMRDPAGTEVLVKELSALEGVERVLLYEEDAALAEGE